MDGRVDSRAAVEEAAEEAVEEAAEEENDATAAGEEEEEEEEEAEGSRARPTASFTWGGPYQDEVLRRREEVREGEEFRRSGWGGEVRRSGARRDPLATSGFGSFLDSTRFSDRLGHIAHMLLPAYVSVLFAAFDALESARFLGVFSLLDLFSSTASLLAYRAGVSSPKPWLESLTVATMMQFGGTTMTGLVLGQPPSWVASACAFPSLLLCWWLMLYCPFDLYYRAMQWRVLALPFALLALCSSAHSVTSWGMDKALAADHLRARTSWVAALLTGTLSACGGGILASTFGLCDVEWRFRVPPCLRRPTLSLTRSFLCAVLYYALRDPHGLGGWEGAVSAVTARGATAVFMLVVTVLDYWTSAAAEDTKQKRQ